MTSLTNNDVRDAIATLTAAENSHHSFRAEYGLPSGWASCGLCSDEHIDAIRKLYQSTTHAQHKKFFTVYSYQTPILILDTSVTPVRIIFDGLHEKYSPTTSRHQNLTRAALNELFNRSLLPA